MRKTFETENEKRFVGVFAFASVMELLLSRFPESIISPKISFFVGGGFYALGGLTLCYILYNFLSDSEYKSNLPFFRLGLFIALSIFSIFLPNRGKIYFSIETLRYVIYLTLIWHFIYTAFKIKNEYLRGILIIICTGVFLNTILILQGSLYALSPIRFGDAFDAYVLRFCSYLYFVILGYFIVESIKSFKNIRISAIFFSVILVLPVTVFLVMTKTQLYFTKHLLDAFGFVSVVHPYIFSISFVVLFFFIFYTVFTQNPLPLLTGFIIVLSSGFTGYDSSRFSFIIALLLIAEEGFPKKSQKSTVNPQQQIILDTEN